MICTNDEVTTTTPAIYKSSQLLDTAASTGSYGYDKTKVQKHKKIRGNGIKVGCANNSTNRVNFHLITYLKLKEQKMSKYLTICIHHFYVERNLSKTDASQSLTDQICMLLTITQEKNPTNNQRSGIGYLNNLKGDQIVLRDLGNPIIHSTSWSVHQEESA